MNELIDTVLKEKRAVLIAIILGSIGGITSVALFSLSGFIISKAALLPPLYIILFLAACLKLFGFLKSLSRYGERLISHEATLTILNDLRMTFYDQLEKITPRVFTKYRSGDLLSRVVGDVETLQNFFLRVFYPPIVTAIVFICTMFFTWFFSAWIAAIILLSLLVTTVVLPALILMHQRKKTVKILLERSALSTEMTEFLFGFRDLVISDQLSNKTNDLLHLAKRYAQQQQKRSTEIIRHQAYNTLLAMLTVVAVLTIGAYFVTTQQLDGLYLAMLVLLTLTVFELAIPMALVPSYMEESKQAMERLQSVMIDHDEKIDAVGTTIKKQPFSVSFHTVNFRYDEAHQMTLKNINFVIPQGTRATIVGASGSGKSTIFQLLLDYYSPSSGVVCVAGQPLESVCSEDLWSKTTVMLQQNHFFYGTVRDNLVLAKDDASDEELLSVLQEMELDFELDEIVYEKGENLSGGEKQRLALARVWLKNTPVWLLDEPFSALDPQTERRIYERMMQKTMGKTVVMISHRLMALQRMDQVLVMDNGELVEVGHYDDLMQKKGYLYDLKQLENNRLPS